MVAFILWDMYPEIFSGWDLPGLLGNIRWYGLLFAMGFIFGQLIISFVWKAEGKPEKDVDALTAFMVVATVVGARLGHCLFYEPSYFLAHPLEILYVWQGGLASHGATVGILTAIYLYSRKRPGQSYLWVLDRIVIVVALGGAFIRTGNLMNSEIIGKPTDAPYAVAFVNSISQEANYYIQNIKGVEEGEKVRWSKPSEEELGSLPKPTDPNAQWLNMSFSIADPNPNESLLKQFIHLQLWPRLQAGAESREHLVISPLPQDVVINAFPEGTLITLPVQVITRHAGQFYEAISTFLVFLLLGGIWWRKRAAVPEGLLFGLFVILVFGLRILWETMKENQVAFEDQMSLNMGQILSIPLVIIGLLVVVRALRKK